MESIAPKFALRVLLGVCLAAVVALGQAAGGTSVKKNEAGAVQAGMSGDEVQRLLGRPASNVQYRNQPGPVWLYHLTDAIDPSFFEVAFSRDGKVISTNQYVDPRAYTGK